jgi:hypothetical protein
LAADIPLPGTGKKPHGLPNIRNGAGLRHQDRAG